MTRKALQPCGASSVAHGFSDCIPFASGNEHKKMRKALLTGLDDAEHGRWISLLVALPEDLSIPPAAGDGNVLIRAVLTTNEMQRGCTRTGKPVISRVKGCGKSAPGRRRRRSHGKPHLEQGQIRDEESLAPPESRVGRSRPSAMTVPDK